MHQVDDSVGLAPQGSIEGTGESGVFYEMGGSC